MNLMVLSPESFRYIPVGVGSAATGSDQAAIIDCQQVPGSDAGAW